MRLVYLYINVVMLLCPYCSSEYYAAIEMCRSDLFYHMTEFHNFDVGDPDNLGIIIMLSVDLVFGV